MKIFLLKEHFKQIKTASKSVLAKIHFSCGIKYAVFVVIFPKVVEKEILPNWNIWLKFPQY